MATADSARDEVEGIHDDDVIVQAQGGTERRVDGAAPQVVVDAICIDGRFLPTVIEKFDERWVIMNTKLVRTVIGVSGVPQYSLLNDIRVAILERRSPRKRRTMGVNVDRDGNPLLTATMNLRGRSITVLNKAWPVAVRPKDLEWILSELKSDAEVGRGSATFWSGKPTMVAPPC